MPEIDATTALAISMQAKKGTYAVLLGSGVSSAAHIPTGWAITKDLIRQVAGCLGEDPGENVDVWYQEKFGKGPSYSDLFDQLGKSRADRSNIIRSYVEPTAEDREQGNKQPTEAHRAIASLVADGHVRIIVSTNFDRLLEIALGDAGVVPSVIATADSSKGILPFVHNSCTIIKIHGDYLDTRIRNTAAELEEYEATFTDLLYQVFHDYGLIVCGWSADWDPALRQALQDSKSPWFSTYWSSRSEAKGKAAELIQDRKAWEIPAMDADTFFRSLAERIGAIDDLRLLDLDSIDMAEATLKRFIHDPLKQTRVRDLVLAEAIRIREAIENPTPSFYLEEIQPDSIKTRFEYYEESTRKLAALFSSGCYWGGGSHDQTWVLGLERLASFTPWLHGYYPAWLDLRYYPSLLTLYSGGIAALAGEQYRTLVTILQTPTATGRGSYAEPQPFIYVVSSANVLDGMISSQISSLPNEQVLSYHMRSTTEIWKPLHQYIPDQTKLHEHFDFFEYLLALVHTDQLRDRPMVDWAPIGYLKGSRRPPNERGRIQTKVEADLERNKENWPLLKAGLCGGSMDRVNAAKEIVDGLMSGRRM